MGTNHRNVFCNHSLSLLECMCTLDVVFALWNRKDLRWCAQVSSLSCLVDYRSATRILCFIRTNFSSSLPFLSLSA